MSRTRNFKPTGRPPKKPGGCIAQVIAYLTEKPGNIASIVAATGYSESSVETAITKLRKAVSPLMANVVDGRMTLRKGASPKRAKRKPKAEPKGPIGEVALATRTPLEEAWAA